MRGIAVDMELLYPNRMGLDRRMEIALRLRLEEKTAGTPVRIKPVDSMDLDRNGKFHLCRCSL